MLIREEGTRLAELLTPLVPQAVTNATATFVDSLKISSISEKVRRGRRIVIKRRNIYSEQLADLANLYFRMSDIPIRFCGEAEEWRRWEVKCFRMFNGDRFRVFASGAKTVCTDKLPGKNLWAAWIWLGVRTSFANPAKVKQRLERIRDVTANLRYYRAFTAKRARTRQSRRASINCQVMSPGTPSPISLARATRERAKAPSPGIPSKFPTKR